MILPSGLSATATTLLPISPRASSGIGGISTTLSPVYASSGVSSVFVIAGDAAEPVGSFRDAPTLLEAMHADGHHFTQVGIGGYPEGHAQIPNELLELSLQRKVAHATQVTTQLCFNPSTTTKWAQRILASGVTLPIRVGLPGAVTRQRLLRITANIGLRSGSVSPRSRVSAMWRFFLPQRLSAGPTHPTPRACAEAAFAEHRRLSPLYVRRWARREAWRTGPGGATGEGVHQESEHLVGVAEDAGFEPARACTQPAFQASAIGL